MVLFLIFFQAAVGELLENYDVKLENWNSGRLYTKENGGNFGPVCVG